MPYVLGLDAGGTKTACLVASTEGAITGRGESGPANFQSCGRVSARYEMSEAINGAIASAAIDRSEVVAAYYGVAGADRDADFETIREILEPINPATDWEIENDSIVGLRAGTPDGVGIGLVAGTGMNAIGRNDRGGRKRVGGLGRFSGDFGAAFDLVEYGLFCAMRGHDGRGDPTILYDLFREAFGLDELEDLIEFYYLDDYRAPDLAAFAPV
ncbi:N-acetylglucosamine kinase, partial [Thermodesulfobacteriota bacterium]